MCVSQHPSALFASWHFFFLFVPLFFTGKNPKTDSDRKTAVHVFMRMDASESFKQEVICRYKQLSSILAHSHPAWHPLNFKLLCVFTYSNPKSSPRSSVCSSSTKDLVDFAVKFTLKSHIGRINSDNKYEHTLTCFKQMRLFSKVIIYYL